MLVSVNDIDAQSYVMNGVFSVTYDKLVNHDYDSNNLCKKFTDTEFGCLCGFFAGSRCFDFMNFKKKKAMCERSVILCPEVRCVTCAKRPLLREVLFPEQPHPERHEDDYFHPPHPTPLYPTLPMGSAENLTCKSCLSKQAGGLIFR